MRKIDKGIPLPKKVSATVEATSTLRKMEVGDSVTLAPEEHATFNTAAHRILGSGNYTIRKLAGEPVQYRLWRTK